jgi:hypothetical protein
MTLADDFREMQNRSVKSILDGLCSCYRCVADRGDMRVRMGSCDCGCKRCPKSSDHRLECTGSNAPGQPGSIYT